MRATPGALFCVLGAAASLPADYSTVPVVDLAAPAVTSTAAVAAALREYGFFYITNHGVPASLIEGTMRGVTPEMVANWLRESQM